MKPRAAKPRAVKLRVAKPPAAKPPAAKPEVVFTRSAPKTGFSEGTESPIAPGVKCGGFLFVSGQGPLDPVTKSIVSQDIAEQTRVTLDNVKAVLEAGGTAIANVWKREPMATAAAARRSSMRTSVHEPRKPLPC